MRGIRRLWNVSVRRFFQFRLRTVLAIFVMIAVCIGIPCDRARRQRRAVNAIQNAGGRVSYDCDVSIEYLSADHSNRISPCTFEWWERESPWPDWLIDTFGKDFFHRVIAVKMDGADATEVVLANVGDLQSIEYLDLRNCKVDFGALVHLSGARNLTYLYLNDTNAADSDLVHLPALPKLVWLDISGDPFSDAGLEQLAKFPLLRELDLAGSGVTDAGLKHLTSLSNLEQVSLISTRVTDAGLVHLRALPKLKRLTLQNTAVTEDGARDLEQAMPNVKISTSTAPWVTI